LSLGGILADESRFAEADAVLQDALQTSPSSKEAQRLRAQIKAKMVQ